VGRDCPLFRPDSYPAKMTTNFRPNCKHEKGRGILRSVNAARNSKSSNVRNSPESFSLAIYFSKKPFQSCFLYNCHIFLIQFIANWRTCFFKLHVSNILWTNKNLNCTNYAAIRGEMWTLDNQLTAGYFRKSQHIDSYNWVQSKIEVKRYDVCYLWFFQSEEEEGPDHN
jgi:hypothetical protein